MAEKTAYDFDLTALNGQPLPLRQFAGRPLVIINGASECGFTPQYAGLQALWQEFKDTGLIVLAVPSNDFGGQEPGDAATIAKFCREKFGIDFPMAAKRAVRGADADPLFQWLSAEGGFFARPRWNFYKYLIGRDGRLADWFASVTRPDSGKFRRAVQRLVKS
jgi:glutathione peroxidase